VRELLSKENDKAYAIQKSKPGPKVINPHPPLDDKDLERERYIAKQEKSKLLNEQLVQYKFNKQQALDTSNQKFFDGMGATGISKVSDVGKDSRMEAAAKGLMKSGLDTRFGRPDDFDPDINS